MEQIEQPEGVDYASVRDDFALPNEDAEIDEEEGGERGTEKILSLRAQIEENPGDRDAYFDLGRLYVYQGRFEEAERMYRRAIELDPDYETAPRNLEILLERMGRESEDSE